MSNKLAERRRKINLNNLDGDTQEAIGLEVGKKIGKIIDNANKLTNEILSIYGLKARISYVLVDEDGEPIEEYAKTMESKQSQE